MKYTAYVKNDGMVANSAGGRAFEISDTKQVERFLILGTFGGSYYATEKELTQVNLEILQKYIKAGNGIKLVDMAVEISESGRAFKNDPAIVALAYVCALGKEIERQYAFKALPKICRIPTHLFQFVEIATKLRGWGKGLRKAVANWYTSQDLAGLQYRLVKYQQREGWSNRDLFRLSHPKAPEGFNETFRWVTHEDKFPKGIIEAVEMLKGVKNLSLATKLIIDWNIPREAVPTEMLTKPEIWEALLVNMPMTAMIRNLGNMTKVGLLAPLSAPEKAVIAQLHNENVIKKARVHPITILMALKTYTSGGGWKSKSTWTTNQKIADALDDAFYASFSNVKPIGNNVNLALDVSGSMGSPIDNTNLTSREVTAAIAMTIARTEENYLLTGFATNYVELKVSPKMRLDVICNELAKIPFGGTDCALPLTWAKTHKVPFDSFIVLTDNETWAGEKSVPKALKEYRSWRPCKYVVGATTATKFSIANPQDPDSLDLCGFDANFPMIASEFAGGRI